VTFARIALALNFLIAVAYYWTAPAQWSVGSVYPALVILVGALSLFVVRIRRTIDLPSLVSVVGTLLVWVPTLLEMTASSGHFDGAANSVVDYSTYTGFALLLASVMWPTRAPKTLK